MNLVAQTVPLATGSDERLVFDYSDGLYRLVYYLPPRPGQLVSSRRVTHKARTLAECLLVVFGEVDAVHDPDLTEHYIRTHFKWGRDLP